MSETHWIVLIAIMPFVCALVLVLAIVIGVILSERRDR